MTASQPLSCCLIGSESLLIQCGEVLLSEGHEIWAVGSPTAFVREWAERKGLAHFDSHEAPTVLARKSFDYLFSIANLMVLPDAVINLPAKGAINFHDGLLPGYAGLNTPVWALLNGEKTHGVTWHVMESKVAAGDILKERLIEIGEDETALTLNAKCYEAAIESFRELIDELAKNQTVRKKQCTEGRRYFAKKKRPSGACVVCWDQEAEAIVAFMRALDFGPYANPLGLAKLLHGNDIVSVHLCDQAMRQCACTV